jgi:hypothetical protein
VVAGRQLRYAARAHIKLLLSTTLSSFPSSLPLCLPSMFFYSRFPCLSLAFLFLTSFFMFFFLLHAVIYSPSLYLYHISRNYTSKSVEKLRNIPRIIEQAGYSERYMAVKFANPKTWRVLFNTLCMEIGTSCINDFISLVTGTRCTCRHDTNGWQDSPLSSHHASPHLQMPNIATRCKMGVCFKTVFIKSNQNLGNFTLLQITTSFE